ncbi:hypothetical protein BV25DRAFT_977781 [Artomyces pyxidatus]|uniref:Uncharacterized protein n=1 Tax=Artomyces pyxidatus TaxID=48021 RepID=A0ACB8SVV3_9AGAM|nr:hypothetical protein BV25DRAFT_977781 [Artomyces pyxidatus]
MGGLYGMRCPGTRKVESLYLVLVLYSLHCGGAMPASDITVSLARLAQPTPRRPSVAAPEHPPRELAGTPFDPAARFEYPPPSLPWPPHAESLLLIVLLVRVASVQLPLSHVHAHRRTRLLTTKSQGRCCRVCTRPAHSSVEPP